MSMFSKRIFFGLIFIFLTSAGVSLASDNQPQDKAGKDKPQTKDEAVPKFSARTELVVVPVLVNDKSGKHITGLKKEDFTVLENGAEQNVAFFEEVTTSSARYARPKSDSKTFTNILQGGSSVGRVTVLVLDLLNTRFQDQYYARQAMTKYLSESLDTSEPTALFVLTRSGLRVIHDFTTDPRVLVAAIKRSKGSTDQVTTSAVEQEQNAEVINDLAVNTEMASLVEAMQQAETNFNSFQQQIAITYTLEAMQQLAKYLAGVPGRKSIVWATSGFPFSVSDTSMALAAPGQVSLTDVLPLYHKTWEAMNNANVALYPVDVRGLIGSSLGMSDIRGTMRRPGMVNRPDWDRLQTQDTMRTFASATGGKAFLNSNDLARGFREAADDASNYYLLAYYLHHSEVKPGWHKLAVKVKHESVQVRARTGFFVNKDDSPAKVQQDDFGNALRSPVNFTEIALVFRWTDQSAAKDPSRKRIGYEVDMPANSVMVDETDNNHVMLQFVSVVRTEDGKIVDNPQDRNLEAHVKPENLQKIRGSGITYRNVLELPPGNFVVRFVVRDALSGKMGSISANVDVAR